MSKIMTSKELSTHCTEAIDELKKLFADFSGSDSDKMVKRGHAAGILGKDICQVYQS